MSRTLSQIIASIEHYEKWIDNDVRYLAYADFKKTLFKNQIFKLSLFLLKTIANKKSNNTYKIEMTIEKD